MMLEEVRYLSNQYVVSGAGTSYGREQVRSAGERDSFLGNGVVFAATQRRVNLFSEASFVFQRGTSVRPTTADIFTGPELDPLSAPSKLLARMDLDAVLSGNAFVVDEGSYVRTGPSLRTLCPWYCSIVLGSNRADSADDPSWAWDAHPIGLIYDPPNGGQEVFAWEEVAHYAPTPDPDARFRGMSCLRPILRPIANSNAYLEFVSRYWANNATPNTVISFPLEASTEMAREFLKIFREEHSGHRKAFRTAAIGAGADLKVIGANLKDLAHRDVSAHEFALICAAIGVPPVIVSIVPGLEAASTYSNYASALRAFADLEVRPRWKHASLELGKLVKAPAGARLWYDVSGVSALQEDAKDDAIVAQGKASTMSTLIQAGYSPDSVTDAVVTGDLSRLQHTGLVSVQLLPPGQSTAKPDPTPPDDGPPPDDNQPHPTPGAPE